LALAGVDECECDQADEQLQLIIAKGLEHERGFLARLRTDGHDIAELDAGAQDTVLTLAAMQQRKAFIYQARLQNEQFGGFADFLARADGASLLGDWHYEAWDTKLARSPHASFIIQLCAYTELLEHLQGRRPAAARSPHQRWAVLPPPSRRAEWPYLERPPRRQPRRAEWRHLPLAARTVRRCRGRSAACWRSPAGTSLADVTPESSPS
jgi:predicted RecB family nuclease